MRDIPERFGPAAFAVLTLALLVYFMEDVVALSAKEQIDLGNLYSAVFDWSAIQTGFLFGIYGFVAGKSSGFIHEIRDTPEMKIFVGRTRRALFLGFTITLFSVPLLVASFAIEGGGWRYGVFVAWSAISVWAFFAFARVAYLFGLLIRVRDVERLHA